MKGIVGSKGKFLILGFVIVNPATGYLKYCLTPA